jgi:hypothetical protein
MKRSHNENERKIEGCFFTAQKRITLIFFSVLGIFLFRFEMMGDIFSCSVATNAAASEGAPPWRINE